MAIMTKFGTPCTVLSGEFSDKEQLWYVKVQMPGRFDVREYPMYELRADDGAKEIVAAVEAANQEA